MADITDFFDEFGQEFQQDDVMLIKYFLQDSLTGKLYGRFSSSYVTPDKNGIFYM